MPRVLVVAVDPLPAAAELFLSVERVVVAAMVARLTLQITVAHSKLPGIMPTVFLPKVLVVAVEMVA